MIELDSKRKEAVLEIFLGVLAGLFVLMLLVTAHEFGHFIMARKAGISVEEFGIGMPPRAVAWIRESGKWRRLRKGEKEAEKIEKAKKATSDKKLVEEGMIFSLNWLPIGGFCRMKDENDASTTRGSFGRASYGGKTKAIFGGGLANFAVAAVILTILAWTGMPHFLDEQFMIDGDARVAMTEENYVRVAEVIEGSPAEEAGLMGGDRIACLGVILGARSSERVIPEDCSEEVVEPAGVSKFTRGHFGEMIVIGYERGDVDTQYATAILPENDESGYVLGVATTQEKAPLYRFTWSAPIVGVGTTIQLTGETFAGVGRILVDFVSGAFRQVSFNDATREEGREAIGRAGEGLAGPIGIVGTIFPQFMSTGLTNLAFLTALISVSLACMNLLPIPALDGGRWVLITIYKLRKKKLTQEIEEKVVSRAFMVLMGLVVVITILDITRLFK